MSTALEREVTTGESAPNWSHACGRVSIAAARGHWNIAWNSLPASQGSSRNVSRKSSRRFTATSVDRRLKFIPRRSL